MGSNHRPDMDHQTRNEPDFTWMVLVEVMEVMLGSLDHGEVQACSISSVPDELRDPKEDAYKPKMVSIGPLHRGATRQLLLMEEPKLRYVREFLDRQGRQGGTRTPRSKLEDCATDILKMDKVIRASYGGNIELEPLEFAKIMIMDGCFLLELLHKLSEYMDGQNQQSSDSQDPILETEEKVVAVLNDITKLENQIPFVVLKKLYRKVFPDSSKIEDDYRVANIVSKAFGYPLANSSRAAHILHMMHLSTVNQNQQEGKRVKQACQELLCCATRLRAAGITIEPASSTNIGITPPHKFVDKFNFDINLSGRVLKIPPLHIKETTEVKWRNLIAWEQSRIWIRCKYTSYALFFQGLICCKHDIDLLLENRVIVNESTKSKEDLRALFRTISKGAEHMDSSYSELCEDLNKYQGTKAFQGLPIITWHHWRRVLEIIGYYCRNCYNILIRDHIPTVWKFIGIQAATLLLVLTFMQTYYTARSSH